jgi:hypothetical protein
MASWRLGRRDPLPFSRACRPYWVVCPRHKSHAVPTAAADILSEIEAGGDDGSADTQA